MFVSWRLELEECVSLRLRQQPRIPQAPDKLFALPDISRTQVPFIVDEIVHQVVVFASNFHIILYQMNLAILWRLELEAWALVRDSWRLGACSF